MPKAKKKTELTIRDQKPAKDPKGGGHGHKHSHIQNPTGDPIGLVDPPLSPHHPPQ